MSGSAIFIYQFYYIMSGKVIIVSFFLTLSCQVAPLLLSQFYLVASDKIKTVLSFHPVR